MQLVFIDDSFRPPGKADLRNSLGPLHSYGAVIADQASTCKFNQAMQQLRADLGVPENTEFKWNPKRSPLKGDHRRQHRARTTMLDLAVELRISATVVVCAPEGMREDWSHQHMLAEILKYLFERIVLRVDSRGGVIVADRPPGGRSDEIRWLDGTFTLGRTGTEYVPPAPDRFPLPILTGRSDQIDLLQLADLVTACTTALVAGSPHAEPYADQLRQILMRNGSHLVGGTGLKLVPSVTDRPDCLLNLLVPTLGETRYVQQGRDFDVQLPAPGWRFEDPTDPTPATRTSSWSWPAPGAPTWSGTPTAPACRPGCSTPAWTSTPPSA